MTKQKTKLSERNLSELEDMIASRTRRSNELGNLWVQKKSLYESLEDKRKPLLASLKGRHALLKSDSAKETAAYVEPEWKEYLDGLAVARQDYLQSQVDLDNSKLEIEVLRSVISTRRQEMKTFNPTGGL